MALIDHWIGWDPVVHVGIISPCGFKRSRREALLRFDTMGHVYASIFMVLVVAENVMSAAIGGPEGFHGSW